MSSLDLVSCHAGEALAVSQSLAYWEVGGWLGWNKLLPGLEGLREDSRVLLHLALCVPAPLRGTTEWGFSKFVPAFPRFLDAALGVELSGNEYG